MRRTKATFVDGRKRDSTRKDPHAPVLSLRADLPLGCNDIVNKALQKDPDKRYQSGAAMAADIRALSHAAAASA